MPGLGPRLRRIGLLVCAAVMVLGLYALKVFLGLNLFEDFSISAHTPLRNLARSWVLRSRPGDAVIEESFELRFPLPRRWSGTVLSGHGEFSPEFDRQGPDGSRCLRISSTRATWWVYSHRYLLAVQAGEEFRVDASVWDGSERGRAEIQIAAYDEQHTVISWRQWQIASGARREYERLGLSFVVPDGVAYIRLRLAGWGQGEFRFDDVLLTRLN